jgi:hypothetical protein
MNAVRLERPQEKQRTKSPVARQHASRQHDFGRKNSQQWQRINKKQRFGNFQLIAGFESVIKTTGTLVAIRSASFPE